jgi:hypothetical protein
VSDELKLLIEWPSRWQEFRSAIVPAFSRSPKRLAGEAPTGMFPYRGMIVSWLAEAALLVAIIIIPAKLASMRPHVPPPLPKYDIIYYSGDELPRTEDVGGAQAGKSGRAGGQQAHHRTQTIRVARGDTLREKVVDAPKLNLPKSDSAVANLLAFKSVPGPPPAEGLPSARQPFSVPTDVVPPTPQVSRDKLAALQAMNTAVIPPPASAPQSDLRTPPLPGNNTAQVIPPPVSAPPQFSNSNPKLSLPTAVIAPPPSQVSRELGSGPGSGPGQMPTQVVPPPVQANAVTGDRRGPGGLGNPNVVPPPVSVSGTGGSSRGVPNGLGGGENVIPPPPSVSAGVAGGQGHGSQGGGRGGPGDLGDPAAPPTAGSSGNGNGVVISSQPGNKVGVPNGGAGAMAMSPNGGTQPGLGGSGGGSGIGRGNGPGSGLAGEGSGSANQGTGKGADTLAKGGTSPYPGTGGAGSASDLKPAVPGVSVQGGSSNVINLPSFGSGSSGSADAPDRSSAGKDHRGPGITVVATARSGGAFNFYGTVFKGENVYTIYLPVAQGTVAMEYEDPAAVGRQYTQALAAPEQLRAELPANLPKSRLVIACVLDRSGLIRNPRVLESGGTEMTAKVMAALPNWKFRPAMRGEEPVEVNAILGFNIDTR